MNVSKFIAQVEKRRTSDESKLTLEDLTDYERGINIRIRSNPDYSILHDKVVLVAPLDNPAALYYYDTDGHMHIVGEWKYGPGSYIGIRSEYKNKSTGVDKNGN